MKVSFNLGAVSVNKTVAQQKKVTSEVTIINGEHIPEGDPRRETEWTETPASTLVFELAESTYSFECEAGELPAIYKEVMPHLTEIVKMLALLK